MEQGVGVILFFVIVLASQDKSHAGKTGTKQEQRTGLKHGGKLAAMYALNIYRSYRETSRVNSTISRKTIFLMALISIHGKRNMIEFLGRSAAIRLRWRRWHMGRICSTYASTTVVLRKRRRDGGIPL
jgi:hypothetical protein